MQRALVGFALCLSLLSPACGGSGTAADATAHGEPTGSGTGGSESTATATSAATSGSGSSTSTGAGGAGGSATGSGGSGGSPPPPCTPPDSPQTFELGTGESCFTRVADGDTLPMMAGPQGGFHMWLALGCTDCGAAADLRWGVRDPQTKATLPDTFASEAIMQLDGSAWPQHAGIIDQLPGLAYDPQNHPTLTEGTHVLLWGEVVAADGSVLHAREMEVVVGPTEPWNPCTNDPNCAPGGTSD